jgi:nucleotide-binding universal stress UspA family protein
LRAEGFETDSLLAGGDPAAEIAAAADREGCDLIAMAVHGHRGLQDVLYGTTANSVRHRTMVPVLMVRGPAGGKRR